MLSYRSQDRAISSVSAEVQKNDSEHLVGCPESESCSSDGPLTKRSIADAAARDRFVGTDLIPVVVATERIEIAHQRFAFGVFATG